MRVLTDGDVSIIDTLLLILFEKIFLLLVNKELEVDRVNISLITTLSDLLLEELCCMKSLAPFQTGAKHFVIFFIGLLVVVIGV